MLRQTGSRGYHYPVNARRCSLLIDARCKSGRSRLPSNDDVRRCTSGERCVAEFNSKQRDVARNGHSPECDP